ncbi:MAG: PLDc N-terminal domain-containing protein [Verrucomicrobia bacterium]|nr:PLDc N-terminal domain-containing protein [Verrucomicrobiota bacterium]MDE3099011.1 PLDc N-terminal domain-containing protein [Verrucomicrobiota bacterium]
MDEGAPVFLQISQLAGLILCSSCSKPLPKTSVWRFVSGGVGQHPPTGTLGVSVRRAGLRRHAPPVFALFAFLCALQRLAFHSRRPALNWLDKFSETWPRILTTLDLVAALLASFHALLHKRDSRAAALWLGLIWFLPVAGPLLYIALGVNRIRRRAVSLGVMTPLKAPSEFSESPQLEAEHLKTLASVVQRVVQRPLTVGNTVRALVNGDEAFPAMLAAIESAKRTLSLSTYIFDNDRVGREFVAALERAVRRGVAVRVLVDAAGLRYSWPPITFELHRRKIPFARFLPASLLTPWRVATINLRNHRKALVADGTIAFTGGMNIRDGHVLAAAAKGGVQDLQFQVEGPVVAQLQEAFASDWLFCANEALGGEGWFPALAERGRVIARAITDGPDADYDKLRLTLLAALADAQSAVQIVTPYFLPDIALVTALNVAALRGVRVDIVLPAANNLPFVHWASRAMWWQVLERGCRVWLQPPPFDHSKLMIVDGHWVFFGSANWDARSLRLNFELNVECYGRNFADEMEKIVRKKIRRAREVSLADVDARPVPAKLRDAAARLFSPYL